jgi:choline dehydrogenase-like flavoprotein
MSAPRIVVVGSGPSAAACAWALAARGFQPLVVDAGRTLEPARALALERALRVNGLDTAFVRQLERSFPVDVDSLPLKPAFGSLFPYAVDEPLVPTRAAGVGIVASLALGGLSNVWGGAILPYVDRDLDDWPIGTAELAPHYRSTFEFVPLAGEHDELEELFPLYGEPERLEPTVQVAALLERLRTRNAELGRTGLSSGRARLAVAALTARLTTPCRYTGLCMHGCPYGSIYNSTATLRSLVDAGRADYRPGEIVERLHETGNRVGVRLRSLDNGTQETLSADRVFIAGGVLGSTRIVLESLEAHDRPVSLLESAYFTVPLLTTGRAARVGRGRAGNTLAQIFLELDDPAISRHGIHLQLYGYNDLMLRAVTARSHLPEAVATRVLQPLLGRLLHAGGYLHSDDSPRLSAELIRDGERPILVLSPGDRADAAQTISRAVAKLRSLRPLTGIHPLRRMLQIWPPGKGFHVGGSLPMRARPGELESDLLGRPTGFRRVHVVDASVLPSLPATTITWSVMANAQRIAAEHDQD